MSQIEEAAARDFAEVTEAAQRESVSEAMEVTLSAEQPTPDQIQSTSRPQVVFLEPPVPEPNSTQSKQAELLPKRPRVTPSASSSSNGTEPFLQELTAMESRQS